MWQSIQSFFLFFNLHKNNVKMKLISAENRNKMNVKGILRLNDAKKTRKIEKKISKMNNL